MELTARPSSRSSPETTLAFEKDLTDRQDHAGNERAGAGRKRRGRLERGHYARGRQPRAGEAGEPISREQQDPGHRDEGEGQRRRAERLQDADGAERRDRRDRSAERDIDPERRPGREKGRERQPDQGAVIAVEPGLERCAVRPSPDRGQCRRDHPEDAGKKHGRGASGDRAPRDGDEKDEAGQRIVLEHHLPDPAQGDIDETQGRRLRAENLPSRKQRIHGRRPPGAAPARTMARSPALA